MKLSKDQEGERFDHVEELHRRQNDLEEAIKGYLRIVEEAWYDVSTAISDYNEALEDARKWRDGLVSDLENAIKGENDSASEWVEEWKSLDLSDLDVDEPDTSIDIDVSHQADDLEGIADEPEG